MDKKWKEKLERFCLILLVKINLDTFSCYETISGKYDARTRALILGVSKSLDILSSLVEMMEESAVKFLTEECVTPKTEYVRVSLVVFVVLYINGSNVIRRTKIKISLLNWIFHFVVFPVFYNLCG